MNTPFETAMYLLEVYKTSRWSSINRGTKCCFRSQKDHYPQLLIHDDDIKAHRDIAYYPAGKNPNGRGNEGKKPNIEAIRQWVANTKIGNASHITISENFGKEYGFIGWGFSDKEKDKCHK